MPISRLVSRSKHWLEVVVLAAALLVPGASKAQSCLGDCDDSGAVTVDELVRAVRIAVTGNTVDECPSVDANHNFIVTVDEIVRAVLNAVDGCPAPLTPLPTETPTPTFAWPTFTPTQNFVCTPPPCKRDEGQYYTCGTPPCTGGCGTICAGERWTPTPTVVAPTMTPTRTVTCAPTGTPYVGNCPECGATGCFNCEMVRDMCPARPCGLCFNATPTPTPSPTAGAEPD
jgi:hypothetical protein